jgi:hypothetical protein
MDNTIIEYLEGYFGGQLNESTSDDDIMEAFADLLETADAVRAFLGEEETLTRASMPKKKPTHPNAGPETTRIMQTPVKDITDRMRDRASREQIRHARLNSPEARKRRKAAVQQWVASRRRG